MERRIPIRTEEDIPAKYRDTAIGLFLRYHNLGYTDGPHQTAQLLVGMCMDHRKALRVPDNFAYVLRAGGGNLRYSEFKVSYAVAIGGVKAIALIAHNNCGMVNLVSKREAFVNGLVENAGWEREYAEEHFMNFAPMFEIGNEIDFVLSEAQRIRKRYPKVVVAPMFYDVNEQTIYLVRENE